LAAHPAFGLIPTAPQLIFYFATGVFTVIYDRNQHLIFEATFQATAVFRFNTPPKTRNSELRGLLNSSSENISGLV
jgi:hypothetical protein